jgi:hypothetical protein
MTALAAACLLTIAVTLAGDLFVPDARDTEVWLGFEVTGAMARATAPIHYAIFAIGAWAFWTQRPWALTAGAAYLFYAAVSHVVWSEASARGRGWPIGLLQAAAISAGGVALLRARARLAA